MAGKKKKVLKKVLKKVPGPIGSVARLSGLPRKLVNAAKNAKNLKPLKKGVGFPKATKKQMKAFKKAMDLKSPALKKVYEAGKKRTPAQIKKDKALMKADKAARKEKQDWLKDANSFDGGGNRMSSYNPARARKKLKKLGLPKKKSK